MWFDGLWKRNIIYEYQISCFFYWYDCLLFCLICFCSMFDAYLYMPMSMVFFTWILYISNMTLYFVFVTVWRWSWSCVFLCSESFGLQFLCSGYLGGGFKYFLFSLLPGEMIHFDKYFSKGLKPSTSWVFVISCIQNNWMLHGLGPVCWRHGGSWRGSKMLVEGSTHIPGEKRK